MSNKTDFSKFDLESYVNKYAKLDTKKSKPGDAWFKCCFHDEKTASLRVSNKQVFHCHGCGVNGGIIDFIQQKHGYNLEKTFEEINKFSGEEVVALEIINEPKPFYEPLEYVAKYVYNNGHVLKYKLPKGSYAPFIWGNYDGKNWWTGVGEHEVGLYAPNGLLGTVVLAEGEKDADALCAMGFNGASSPNGTYKWKDQYTEELKDADRVVLLNDNDTQGIQGVMACNRDLILGGIITKRILPHQIEPDDTKGYDIDDVVQKIGLEETKDRLQALIDNEDRWDARIYTDKEILSGAKDLGEQEIDSVPQAEVVEVEIVFESGLGEEYDNLVSTAVSEIIQKGMQEETTTKAIREYAANKKNGVGIRDINSRIKILVEEEKSKNVRVIDNSEVMRIEELQLDIDINGSGYYMDNYSGGIFDEYSNEVVGHFLGFAGVVIDAELEQDNDVKIALAYNTPQNKNLKLVIVSKKNVSSTNEIVNTLSGYNINVTSVNAALVVKYIQDLQNHFKEKTITMKSLSRFGWFEDNLMPFEQGEAKIVFDSTVAQPIANKLLETKGKKELSLQLINEMANYSESNAVILGTSVASLVLSYLDDGGSQSFALNVWAATSTGKSVTCQGVASMIGYPFKDGGWWGDGNATLNADMYHNALLGNIPNFIDDPALNRGYDSFEKRDYIYKVTGGQGRARMNRDGKSAQEVRTWCNTVIMTNETMFIDDNIHEGGARARCLEINFDKPLDTSTVERWIELMTNNYGHFALDIANKIRSIGKLELSKRLKDYIRYFNSNEVDGKRTINASYVMLGLDVMKETLGIEAIDPREWFIKQIRGSGELSPGFRAYEKLMARIQVSEDIYRNVLDRDGVFIGVFGVDAQGRKVVNLPARTLEKYGREDNYNYAELIHWGYANNIMVAKYNEYDKPISIKITNGVQEVKVVQVFYDYQGVTFYNDNDINSDFRVVQEIIDI